MQQILQWDYWLFFKINTEWTHSLVDEIYPWWRDMTTWYPLYLFLIVFVWQNMARKNSFLWLFFIAITITLSDQLSSSVIKEWVQRLRPCHDPAIAPYARMLLDHCSGGFSFTSSHATNHFAAAFFFFRTLQPYFGKWAYLFFAWAATISYGQVYTGVHFPLDIICGAIMGGFIGWGMSKLYHMASLRIQPSALEK